MMTSLVVRAIKNVSCAGPAGYKCWLRIAQCEIGGERIVLPDNLEHLWIYQCKNMGSSLNKTALLENAIELRWCGINNCEEIESVVGLDSLCCPVLDKLEELRLSVLPRLRVLLRVEGVATPPRVFFNLKILVVSRCSGMRELLPLELLQALQNLEKIYVEICEKMEEIITASDSEASSNKFFFPKLRILDLLSLPQLKSICSGKGVMIYDSIERIRIFDCRVLKRIPLQLPPLDNGQPSPPPHLREIRIGEDSKEWWELVEWDHPNAKNLLQRFLKYSLNWWD